MSGKSARCSAALTLIMPPKGRYSAVAGPLGGSPRWLAARLAETGRPKLVVGLDDLAEPILRAPVAAICVRMEALHQLVEPRLDLRALLTALEVEDGEGPACGV